MSQPSARGADAEANRERRRPTAADRVQVALFTMGCAFFSALPRKLTFRAAALAGRCAWHLMPVRRRVVRENLACAWPDLPETERERVARGSFRHAAAMAIDLLTLPRVARDVAAHCEVDARSLAVLAEAKARGKGVILVAGHFGLFESMGILLGSSGFPVSFVAKPFRNPLLDARIRALRGATGNTTITKGGAKAKVLAALRSGALTAIVADQHVTWQDRCWIPFFSLPAATARSLGTLALESGAPIVPIHSFPLPDGRCRCEFGPILDPPAPAAAAGAPDADRAEALVGAAIAEIEKATRRQPSAWLWLHRRWKICPDADRARYPFYTQTESEERRALAERWGPGQVGPSRESAG